MCGRIVLNTDTSKLLKQFRATLLEPLEWQPRFNIAPTQLVPVVVSSEREGRLLRIMRWGLIPSWAKDDSMASKLINCRAETAHEKPSFRSALSERRCIIPISGFYEWKKDGKNKIPHLIAPLDGGLLGLAGLWESWKREGTTLHTFTILTTEANPFIQIIHDRMPRILDRSEQELWLDPYAPLSEIRKLANHPSGEPALVSHPVSRKVNSPAHDGPELLRESKPRQGTLPLFLLCFTLLTSATAGAGCAVKITRPCSEGGDVSWRSSKTQDGNLIGDKHCIQKKLDDGRYVNHGIYKLKHPNGKLALEGRFELGKKEGFWSEFDEKGEKVAERYFEAGVEKTPPAASAERKSK